MESWSLEQHQIFHFKPFAKNNMTRHTIRLEWIGHGVVNVAPVVLGIKLTAQRIRPVHLHMCSGQSGSDKSDKGSFDNHFVDLLCSRFRFDSREETMSLVEFGFDLKAFQRGGFISLHTHL